MKKYIYLSFIAALALLFVPAQGNVAKAAEVRGDLNADSVVNSSDVEIVLEMWGPCKTSPCRGDLDANRQVDGADLGIVLGNFTQVDTNTTPGASTSNKAHRAGRISDADLKRLYDRKDFSTVARDRIRAAFMERLSTSNTSDSRENADDDRNDRGKLSREIISKRFSDIVSRFRAAVARLEQLTERIESRMEKLKANNIDVSTSARFVAQAKVELKAAQSDIASLPRALGETTTASRDAIMRVRSVIASAKGHLIAAHKNLIDAISNLKPGINKIEKMDAKANTGVGASVQSN